MTGIKTSSKAVKLRLLAMAATLLASGGSLPAAGESFLLVESGLPKATIVTAEHPTPVEHDAVNELNEWIEKITGTPLPVSTYAEWHSRNTSAPYLAIGTHPLTDVARETVQALPPESARIVITPQAIILVGKDTPDTETQLEWRGTYYAVRELLEKRLGVRSLWPGSSGNLYPRQATLALTTGEWTWVPQLTASRWMRNGYTERLREEVEALFGITIDKAAWSTLHDEQAQWLKRQRMNIPSRVKFGHAFTNWWANHAARHPDWFALPPAGITQPGGPGVKLNLSHPGVHQQIIDDWQLHRQQAPLEATFLTICPNDSRGYCTRPENRAWDGPEAASLSDAEIWSSDKAVVSDRYVRFANTIARRAAEIDPAVTITTYAYRNYRQPPQREQVDPNVLIAYVGGEGYYPDERFITTEWKGWAEKGASLFWRPNLLQAGHGMPYIYARQLRDDFALFLEHRMLGTNFDSITGNWGAQGLNYYVASQMHFRPQESYETFLDEYTAAFGKAAATVKSYLLYFEEETRHGPALLRDNRLVPRETWGGWWQGFIRLVPHFMNKERIARGRELLAQAEAETAQDEPIIRERVAFLRQSLEHAALMSETFANINFKRTAVASRAQLAALWKERLNSLTSLSVSSPRLLMEEQRQFGLWDAYLVKNRKHHGLKLTSGWSLKADPQNRGLQEEWASPSSPTEGWEPVSVEVPWANTRAGKAILEKTSFSDSRKSVWYRREIELPELDDTAQRLILRFSAVDAEVKVWVDGQLLLERNYPHNGDYDSWKTPFDVDLSALATGGKRVHVVLRVVSDRANGGITGPVHLIRPE